MIGKPAELLNKAEPDLDPLATSLWARPLTSKLILVVLAHFKRSQLKPTPSGTVYRVLAALSNFHKESVNIHRFFAIIGGEKDYCIFKV